MPIGPTLPLPSAPTLRPSHLKRPNVPLPDGVAIWSAAGQGQVVTRDNPLSSKAANAIRLSYVVFVGPAYDVTPRALHRAVIL